MIVKYSKKEKASDEPFLSIGREYVVIGIEGDWFRIVNDRNEPILYDPNVFTITDFSEPSFWTTEYIDGERYSYPENWSCPGFFEDYHDGVLQVVAFFWKTHKEYFGEQKNRITSHSSGQRYALPLNSSVSAKTFSLQAWRYR
jgi:hypothetical protein